MATTAGAAPAAAESATATAPPRERILDAANTLFYTEGIQGVGMDRLVRAAGVTKTTMYRQFASKDELVEAYMLRRAERERIGFTALVESINDPREAVRRVGVMLLEHDLAEIWRGCPFVNASAEFAQSDHVIRRIARDHRKWVIDMTVRLLTQAGHPQPEAAGRLLMMLRTGAVIAAALDGDRDFDAEFLAACDQVVEGNWPMA